MKKREDDTQVTRATLAQAVAEHKSVNQLARAMLRAEGHRLLIILRDKRRALKIAQVLVDRGLCDSLSIVTTLEDAQDCLHDANERFDVIAVEEVLRPEIYLNGRGGLPIVVLGDNDEEVLDALSRTSPTPH